MDKHSSAIFPCCFVLVMTWLSSPISCNGSVTCLPDERDALLSMKNDLHPSAKFPYLSWKGFNCCQWEGVQCSSTSHVVKLQISCSNFSLSKYELEINYIEKEGIFHTVDPLPTLSPNLFRLRQLEHLHLSFNGLTGVIPAGLFSLKSLRYLDMSFNYFEDKFPEGIGSLVKLVHLNLEEAGFNGSIPIQLGNLVHLQFLDLSSFRLESSSLEWIQNMPKLEYLSLDGVTLNMTGEKFGACIAGLHNLHYLDAGGCQLSGSLPTALLNLTSLAHLDLDFNLFSSAIPLWLGNMTALVSLQLYYNAFYGQFPLSLSRLPRLQDVGLGNNSLTGDISEIFAGEWPHLTTFILFRSNVTGSIPPSVGNLSTLHFLYLSSNQLSGNIPVELAGLSSLQRLSLAHNHLNGSVPSFVGRDMELINLQSNNLQGDVLLDSFQNSAKLEYLSVSHNHFTVHISPQWIPKSSFLHLDLASCNIRGILPEFISAQYMLEYMDLSNNSI